MIVGFGSSEGIAHAYGVTIAGAELMATCLLTLVMAFIWKVHPLKFIWYPIVFITIDGTFFASNLEKVPSGGWVSILIASFFTVILLFWTFGEKVSRRELKNSGSLSISQIKQLISSHGDVEEGQALKEHTQLPVVGVFVTNFKHRTPQSISNLALRIHALPKTIVFLTLETSHEPFVTKEGVISSVRSYRGGIYRIIAKIGYADARINAVDILARAQELGFPIAEDAELTFFVEREHIKLRPKHFIKIPWYFVYSILKKLFSSNHINIEIPEDKSIEVGVKIFLR